MSMAAFTLASNKEDDVLLTSGHLKYFFPLVGKTVQITIEVMEYSNEH